MQQYCISPQLNIISMKKVVLFLFLSSLFFSCKKEEVVPTDDNELITTVELIFTDANKKVSTFSFQDKDGDGKTPPEKFDKIVLDKNMAYTMEVHMYDETKNPKLDITEDIESESNVHLFVFKIDPASLFNLKASDKDKNGLFTRILLKEMSKPGIPVDRVLRNVRNEVVTLAKSVGHEQTPALYDQAVGEFFFKN